MKPIEDRILSLAAALVPRARRDEWRREWAAELHEMQREGRSSTARSLGAFPDAVALRLAALKTDSVFADLRSAIRSIRRATMFSAIAIGTMAVGIGGSVAVFSIVDSVLLEPLPLPESEQLVLIWDAQKENPGSYFVLAPRNVDLWYNETRSFESVAWFNLNQAVVEEEQGRFRHPGAAVSWNYFHTMGQPSFLGRWFNPEEQGSDAPPVVMLSHGFWQRQTGADSGIVGQEIVLSGRPRTVVGVMPPGFQDPVAHFFDRPDFWTPFGFDMSQTGGRWVRVVARLRDGVTLDAANEEVTAIAAALERDNPDLNEGVTMRAVGLRDGMVADARLPLMIFLAAVTAVLLLTAVNLAGLLLARSLGRRREFALRAALGAGRARVARLLLVESMLLTGLGGMLGILLATRLVPLLVSLAPDLPRADAVEIDASVLIFAVGVTVITGLAFGLLPGMSAVSNNLSEELQAGGSRIGESRGKSVARRFLIGTEVALSILLLVGAGLLGRSFARITSVDPGFRTDGILTARVDLPSQLANGRGEAAREIVERLESMPGVRSAGATTTLPLSDLNNLGFTMSAPGSSTEGGSFGARFRGVTPGYLEVMRARLLRGRLFTGDDWVSGDGSVIVNDLVARDYYDGLDPIGSRIEFELMGHSFAGEIVGVVQGHRYTGFSDEPHHEIFVPYSQAPLLSILFLAIETEGRPESVAGDVRSTLTDLIDGVVVDDLRSMNSIANETLLPSAAPLYVFGVMSFFGLILAALGLFGLLAHDVRLRARELGIRMALGASGTRVRGMVIGDAARIVLPGVIVGLLLAAAATRAMAGMLYHTDPLDPVAFGGVPVVLIAVAGLAAYLPARRAARVDPVTSLRME